MKFCKKCGAELLDNAGFCGKCGEKVSEPIQQSGFHPETASPQYVNPPVQSRVSFISLIQFIAGALVLLLCFIAGFKIMDGANDMVRLSSVSGTSVAEAFYNYSGSVYNGFALFVIALGIFGGMIFFSLGMKNLKK